MPVLHFFCGSTSCFMSLTSLTCSVLVYTAWLYARSLFLALLWGGENPDILHAPTLNMQQREILLALSTRGKGLLNPSGDQVADVHRRKKLSDLRETGRSV